MRHAPLRAPSAFAGPIKTLAFLLFLPFAFLCCASNVKAVPVVITGGSVFTSQGSGNFGVNITAPGFSFSVLDSGAPKGQLCGLCSPGGTFPGTIALSLPDTGSLSYNGISYGPGTAVVGIIDRFIITLPSFIIPADLSPVVSTFSLSGALGVSPFGGAAPFTLELTGSGTVTFTFIPRAGGGSTLGAAVFAFDAPTAVPEPATILLLGAGLAGMAAKVRRRRKVA